MQSMIISSRIKRAYCFLPVLAALAFLLPGCGGEGGNEDTGDGPEVSFDPVADRLETAGEADPVQDPDAEVRADPDAQVEIDAMEEETIAPPPCGDGACERGVEHCDNCEMDCCACPAEAVLIDCPLTDGSACTGAQSGGTFGAGGWVSDGLEARIVFDFGVPVNCGAAHLHIGPFNPMTQYVHNAGDDRYCDFFDIFQQNTGDHWAGADGHECWVDLQVSDEEPDTFRDHNIKMKAHTGTGDGFGGGEELTYTAHDVNWEVPHDLCLEWNGERMALFIDGSNEMQSSLTWGTDGATGPGLRYLFVGRGRDAAGGWLSGATYSNVRVVAGGTCP